MKFGLCLLLVGTAACRPHSVPDAVAAQDTASVTVRQVIDSAALVGRTVKVGGRCLGYQVPTVAIGSPPRSRSDWQLEDAGAAVYVTGPLPAGCGASGGSPVPATIVATVAEDTLPGPAGRPAIVRRYLVRR